MNKYIVKIDGMMCGMCESHINDVIRQNFDVKKVKSNHKKGETIITANSEIDIPLLKSKIAATGYTVTDVIK